MYENISKLLIIALLKFLQVNSFAKKITQSLVNWKSKFKSKL